MMKLSDDELSKSALNAKMRFFMIKRKQSLFMIS